MLLPIIILLLLFGGGGGYYGYSRSAQSEMAMMMGQVVVDGARWRHAGRQSWLDVDANRTLVNSALVENDRRSWRRQEQAPPK